LAFSCCAPIESTDDYSAPAPAATSATSEPVVEEYRSPIDLEFLYDYSEEEVSDPGWSYVEMFKFRYKGMDYIHVQEDNGDGYGYVINVTKDSLEVELLKRQLQRKNSSTQTLSEHEQWYNSN